jgi:hypothetical protein
LRIASDPLADAVHAFTGLVVEAFADKLVRRSLIAGSWRAAVTAAPPGLVRPAAWARRNQGGSMACPAAKPSPARARSRS